MLLNVGSIAVRSCGALMCSGASLINTNLLLRMEQQHKAEQKILDDIKKKMDRIKERHIKERNKRSRELDESTPDQETTAQMYVYQELTDHYEGLTNDIHLIQLYSRCLQ